MQINAMVREPYLTIDTKRKKSMIIHCLIIIQGFIMKNSKGILLRALLCFALSYFLCAQFITQPTVCSAKIYKVKEHKKPAGLKGEFIAYYDFQKKETTYYDKNEIPTKKFQKKMNYKPQKPDEKLIQRYKVKSVNTPTKLLNTNFTSDVNTTGTSLYSYLPDNRIKVSSSQINSFPYYSICKLTMTFPDSPGYVTLGTGYELWNKLCATAGHCLLNSNGKYFNSIKAEFGYNNGTCINQQAQLTLSMTVLLTPTTTACRDRVAHHYISQVDMPLA